MGSNRQQDYLGECNNQGVALPDFQATFCARCVQPECVRSQFGKTKFDQRVQNWYENLFKNPPRMDPQDPRYSLISGQRFLTIDTGPIPEVRTSEWHDPRDLKEPEPAPVLVAPPAPVAKAEEPVANAAAAPVPPKATPAPKQRRALPVNTPHQGGVMIGAPVSAPAPAPAKDPWAGPAPKNPNETVVTPGAKVKIGSGV